MPLATRRTHGCDGAVAALPGAQNVRREAGALGHDADWVQTRGGRHTMTMRRFGNFVKLITSK